MYAAIYSYEYLSGRRKHLGNITDIEYDIALRTYDFSTASISGKCLFEINRPLLYIIKDDRGRQKFAGFIKNIKMEKDSLAVFAGDDFKKILDTEIILDFSQEATPDFTFAGVMTKVTNSIMVSKDPFISTIGLQFIIPADTTDTKAIADYTGQYLVVNAIKFLKVYLSYYGYYIAPYYDVIQDSVIFQFKKMTSEVTEIKLKDFTHEKTSADIKVNKTVATISYKTIVEDASWIDSNNDYFYSQIFSNRATVVSTELPNPEGYAVGFALRLVSGYTWQEATHNDYLNAINKSTVYVSQYGVNVCYTSPSFSAAIEAAGDANLRSEGTVVRALIRIHATGEVCTYPTYIKVVPISQTYHRASDVTYKNRPNLPEKVYTLGNDNQIYEGYAPEEKRIYPIVAKVFESSYLSEAQLNAVYEIVNNRYVENIIVTMNNMISTLDLESLELYTQIRVYDDSGSYKDIPISEKAYTHKKTDKRVDIKLGFKKTLLTEIIKNEIGLPDVVKSSGGGNGSNTVIEQADVYTGETAPDPKNYLTWFKPIAGDGGIMMSMTTGSDELVVEETSGEYVEPAEEPAEETTELTVEGASPYESA